MESSLEETETTYHVVEVEISPERYTPSIELEAELVDHTAENGKIISCVQKGSVKVAIDKINIYCMGKVPMYPKEELQELQRLKQSDSQKFDAEPVNEERLVFIRDRLKHNWELSQEMFETIKQTGWGDSVDVVDKIIAHLLSVGEGVTVETRVRHSSQLEAPLGSLFEGTKYMESTSRWNKIFVND